MGGVKPVAGDILTAQVVYKLVDEKGNDSVLFDSRVMPNALIIKVIKSEYPGDLYEGLTLLGEGDSATLILNPYSFYYRTNRATVPKFVKKGSKIYFDVNVLRVQKLAEYVNEQRELNEKERALLLVQKKNEITSLQKYLHDNSIKVSPGSDGMYFIELAKGRGPRAAIGKTVRLRYRGTLLDGTVFDERHANDSLLEFELGAIQKPGWNEAISQMKAGGKAKIIVPSKLGYGSRGVPGSIPPFSPLVFELELIEVK